jgi:hypothetical protein
MDGNASASLIRRAAFPRMVVTEFKWLKRFLKHWFLWVLPKCHVGYAQRAATRAAVLSLRQLDMSHADLKRTCNYAPTEFASVLNTGCSIRDSFFAGAMSWFKTRLTLLLGKGE